ncbi:uncharacterized protein BDZ99DRAFT_572022 [Mytilinidion resinicola]|uniref:Aminoglycoside phosphotransferase domain-containing protein n=1 Tax=Mytilinidion resinicola TaxID=574789 RepID=A0A6A6YML7_9PEZI|nr:uncharacterized protein BDZ99DRAFT_572022 [Mytilinidion resinicola]KAF2809234.1 hypothetical protein BDZ99DRAFT_572022 [Mytilinidion resinicola]
MSTQTKGGASGGGSSGGASGGTSGGAAGGRSGGAGSKGANQQASTPSKPTDDLFVIDPNDPRDPRTQVSPLRVDPAIPSLPLAKCKTPDCTNNNYVQGGYTTHIQHHLPPTPLCFFIMTGTKTSAAGFRWNVFSSFPDGLPLRIRADAAFANTDWDALLEYASKLRNGAECRLLPDIGMGANNMVRVIEFNDGKRWAARVRMPHSLTRGGTTMLWDQAKEIFDNEVAFLNFMRQSSDIPVPAVYAHETTDAHGVHAPFILMECVEGNVGSDMFDNEAFFTFPDEQKATFFDSVAEVHNEDGTYIQGPIHRIGGPFDTATEFFQAWAKNIRFGHPKGLVDWPAKGGRSVEIPASVAAFQAAIDELSSKISVRDKGPFPIWHDDCGHNNLIMGEQYRVLGVIDWEMAYAAPWEIFGDYPHFIDTIPRPLSEPGYPDEQVRPLDEEGKLREAHQKQYIAAVIRAEAKRGLTLDNHTYLLSAALQDTKRQELATSMALFAYGRGGWYRNVTDELAKSLLEKSEVSDVKEDVTTASSSGTFPSTT